MFKRLAISILIAAGVLLGGNAAHAAPLVHQGVDQLHPAKPRKSGIDWDNAVSVYNSMNECRYWASSNQYCMEHIGGVGVLIARP